MITITVSTSARVLPLPDRISVNTASRIKLDEPAKSVTRSNLKVVATAKKLSCIATVSRAHNE